MQSNHNPEGMIVLAAIGIVLLLIQALVAIALAAALIVAVGASLLYGIALFGPYRLAGEILTPQEAREFFLRAFVSGIAVVVLMALAGEFGFPLPITDRALCLCFLFGYLYGGVALDPSFQEGFSAAQNGPAIFSQQEVLPPLAPPSPPPSYTPPPFDFAEWDDEDEFHT